jgi:DNA-binding transcriptional LysR family regulator
MCACLTREQNPVARHGAAPTTWRYQENGELRPVRVTPRLTVSTNDAAVSAAELGFGVARLISYQVATEVAAGTLALVLEDFELEPIPIHIIHREGRAQSAKVRAFVDLMAERLRSIPDIARRSSKYRLG